MGVYYVSDALVPRLLRVRSLASSQSAAVREGVGKLGSIRLLAGDLRTGANLYDGKISVARMVAGCLREKGLASSETAQLVGSYFEIVESTRRGAENRLPQGWPMNDLNMAKVVLDDLVPLAKVLGNISALAASRYLNALLEITSDGIIRRVCPFSVPATKIAPGAISALAGLFKPVVGDLPKVDDVLEALDFMGPLRITAEDKGKLFGQIFAHRNIEVFTGIICFFAGRHNYSGDDKLALFAAANDIFNQVN